MLSGAHRSGGVRWQSYDSRFRQQLPSLEKAEFGKLDQALYTRSILTARAGSGPAPPSQSPSEWQGPPGPKRKCSMACFAWNDGKSCVSTPCRITHVCFRVVVTIGSGSVAQWRSDSAQTAKESTIVIANSVVIVDLFWLVFH